MILAAMALTACVAGEELEKEYTAKANSGDPEGQYQLSLMYFTGNGVDQSDKKGAYWGRRAADQGHREAQSNLAEMYAIGVIVRKNLVEADKWFTLSSDQGFGPATRRMREVEETMTPQQIEQAKALAREWKPKIETPQAQSTPSVPGPSTAAAATPASASASK
ncbi:MAG: tetratricopeptide repeat protein [Burkholderiaceae bacterium]|nr:tetratricopeptide repeat protein [Burkholderiaceae bacterium]